MRENEIEWMRTDRGFIRGDFVDHYHESCSIQESSLVDEAAVWLGCNAGTHHHVTGECLARMHLTREQVKALLPYLNYFAENGCLPARLAPVEPVP